jgi:multiple sugar transport system substrate-binding protein
MSGRLKRTTYLVGVAALLVTVFGGASNFASASGTGGKTLNTMGFTPGDEIATVRAEEAEKALGGAKVDIARGGFNDQQFLAAVASGNVPDVVYVDRAKVGTYAAKGAFLPLTSCIRSESIDVKQYRAAAMSEVTYKNRVYAIPEFTNQRVLIINDSVLRKAGVTVADVQTTNWPKLRAANKKLLERSGDKVSRIGFDPKLPEFFPLWTKANGHNILSKDGLKASLDHPKAIEALTFAYSLIQDHGGWDRFKAFRDTWDFFGAKNQVAEDQIGAWPMENFYFNVLAQNSPQVNITAKAFTNRRGGAITWITGNGWAIPKGAKDPDLACKWMKAMTATNSWVKAAKERFDAQKRRNRPFTGVYTANTRADVKIYEDIYQKMGRADFDNAVQLLVNVQKYSFTIPASPASAEFQQAWQDAINRVLAGKQSPRAALRQAQREAQRAIDRAK